MRAKATTPTLDPDLDRGQPSPRIAVLVFPGSNDDRDAAWALRAIGADQPRAGHVPVNLKPVLRLMENGCEADYEIGFFRIEK